jgi:hypothetical protein
MIRDLEMLGGTKLAQRDGKSEILKTALEKGIYSATAIDFSREYESAFTRRR